MASNDLRQQLRDDARRLKLGRNLPANGPLTHEQIDAVRSDLRALCDASGTTIHSVVAEIGTTSERSVRRLLATSAGDAAGDLSDVARRVNVWIETLARRASALPAGFIETGVARDILLAIRVAVDTGTIGLVMGPAGIGKTMALEAARKVIHPGAIVLRMRSVNPTPLAMLRQLAELLGEKQSQRTFALFERVARSLKASQRPVLVDQAHELTPGCVKAIVDLHDEAGDALGGGLPILMCGTSMVRELTGDEQLHAGQISSRCGIVLDLLERMVEGGDGGPPLFTADEIAAMWTAQQVRLTGDAGELLAKIANQPGRGSLRLVRQLVRVSVMAAGGEPITPAMVRSALRSLQGVAAVRRMDSALVAGDRRKTAVA